MSNRNEFQSSKENNTCLVLPSAKFNPTSMECAEFMPAALQRSIGWQLHLNIITQCLGQTGMCTHYDNLTNQQHSEFLNFTI